MSTASVSQEREAYWRMTCAVRTSLGKVFAKALALGML